MANLLRVNRHELTCSRPINFYVYCGKPNICALIFTNAVSAAEVMQSGIRNGLNMKSGMESTCFSV